MQIDFVNNGSEKDVYIKGLSNFNLSETLDCGQCFRFNPIDPSDIHVWYGVAHNRPITLISKEDTLILKRVSEDDFPFWRKYLDLDRDYGQIQEEYKKHPLLSKIALYAPGIRILRQEAFETLISFIISQNNNIKRIKGIVARLCEGFGDEIAEGVYSFPTAERLALLDETALAPLRSGWRAGYILDASQKVTSGEVNLDEIKKSELGYARERLQIIKGVGPKVAECVLLYGMGRLDAFPMDVWMKRAMSTLFPKNKAEDFQPYPGIAQQYIFHYSRLHPELFPGK